MTNFRQIWERTEQENLTRDRNRKIKIMEIDRRFVEGEEAHKLVEEEEKHLEEHLQAYVSQHMSADGVPLPIDEEVKDLVMKQARLTFIGKLLRDREEWQKSIKRLTKYKVLKMPRVMQSIFYFLGYEREKVCEKGTNKFFWKSAKLHLNADFFKRLAEHSVLGQREGHYPRYSTLNFLERNLEGVSAEEVD